MIERPAPTADDIEPVKHETLDRIATGTVTVIPFLALGAIGWQAWADLLGWSDIAVFAIMYLAHRPGHHRRVPPPLDPPRVHDQPRRARRPRRARFAAIEGPVISWVADHRKHHAFADREGDPHSPHVGHGSGWRGRARGLLPRARRLAVHPHPARRSGRATPPICLRTRS